MLTIAIAAGSQKEILEVVKRAYREIEPMLTEKLKFIVFDVRENVDHEDIWEYRKCPDEQASVARAVACAAKQEAQIIFKGIVTTHILLKEILKEEYGLRDQKVLSHVSLLELKKLGRPVLLTDAAMNIAPDIDQLTAITSNAINVAKQIGIERPKIAMISAAENFNPKMPSSVSAKEVAERFSDVPEVIVEGPISLDLALSKDSVAHKHYEGRIQGDADILVVPGIDAGNVLYKTILLFADAKAGGTIVGSKVPIVLTSRSDAIDSKLTALSFAIHQVIGGGKDA